MKRAVKEVLDGSQLRTTATKHKIDKMTLRRYVEKYKKKGDDIQFIPNYASSQIFSNDEETKLADYLIIAAKMNYGLTSKDTRKLAYLYAIENQKKIPENWKNSNTASYDWIRGFLLRNKNLSFRTPEPTSLSRGTAFNKHTVGSFYALLRSVLEREKLGPECIYNCDETGIQTVHKPSKIICQKGLKQVSKATSGERGQTVTVLCTINAIGNTIPPYFVFPRIREQDYMTNGAPAGSKAGTHVSGWMTMENFAIYLQHFVHFVKCTQENKVLLILDNHSSHISPRGLDICKNNGIILLTIPPHTSNRLQPLDVSVYGPFKTYYNQACDDFMVGNPGQTITLKEIAKLADFAYQKAFTKKNIISGFSKTGIYPFNSQTFSDDDFLTSNVTDRPEPPHTPEESNRILPIQTPETGPSYFKQENNINDTSPVFLYISPEEIKPFPKAPPRKKILSGRKPLKTKILTDSPNMNEIKEEFIKRQTKSNKENFKRNLKKTLSVAKKPKNKKKCRNIWEKSESDSSVRISSSSSEEISDTQDQTDKDETEDNFAMAKIDADDYVLAKFKTNKSVKHYVGIVLERGETECLINFMRVKQPMFHFIYPDVQDVCLVPEEDLIKLPPPSCVSSTSRASTKFTFPIDFHKFENLN